MSTRVRQCVLLAGGLGTRLGGLTRETPKPMLPVAGRPFLEHLVLKAGRHGFERVLILAGYKAGVIADWSHTTNASQRLNMGIEVVVEPQPLGTGGALAFAGPRLDETFLLVNGDTWFDFDWRDLADASHGDWTLALRQVDQADRYETVVLDGERVRALAPRREGQGAALINGGVYRGSRSICPTKIEALSLERDLLPSWAVEGRLGAKRYCGEFIDIGVPDAYARAQDLLADPAA